MIHMIQDTRVQQRKAKWRQIRADPRVRMGVKALGYGLGAFLLSTLSLGKEPQPITLGLIFILRGWRAFAATLGGMAGYRAVWEDGGNQALVWCLGGYGLAMALGKRRSSAGWLLPAIGALTVSVTGLLFQLWQGQTGAVGLYWIRVAVGGLSVRLFQKLAVFLESEEPLLPRKGEVATAQVRLEIMAGVLNQTQQLLMEVPPNAIDQEALLARTRERACGGCPNRKGCTEVGQLDIGLLTRPLTDTASLGGGCRKPNRLLLELRRTQEQLRMFRSEASRRRECREAVVQQYRFLSGYLRQTAEGLSGNGDRLPLHYKSEVRIVSRGKEEANGDKCQAFAGAGGKYYVLLCDGMGSGLGAEQEGQKTLGMLRQMLTAGFPAEYTLQSLNSLCCLRGRAGAMTVDLVELWLDTGKTMLYKWGASPSVLLRGSQGEKIGTAGPPPGLDVNKTRETVDKLSLRRGETLILMSDGVDAEAVLRCGWIAPGEPLGEFAAKLLDICSEEKGDDATVAAIRLHPTSLYT